MNVKSKPFALCAIAASVAVIPSLRKPRTALTPTFCYSTAKWRVSARIDQRVRLWYLEHAGSVEAPHSLRLEGVRNGMATKIVQRQPGTRFTRKRVLIIRAAAQAFGRKGFHATKLEEIAADLNLTKASLYYYFSTKEELLFEVHLLSLQDVLDRVDRILATEKTPIAQLEGVITEHLRVLASDYEGAFLLQQEYELPANYRAEIVRLRDAYEQRVLEIIREGVRQRQFRVKNAKVTVRIVLGPSTGCFDGTGPTDH